MDTPTLLWGLLFSSIGLGYFIYGKKRSNMVIRYTGLVLMVYPYFIHNATVLFLVGVGLMLLPRFVKV